LYTFYDRLSNAVLCIDASVPSQPVFSSPGAILMNRRLVLKQLPSGQFALTVQSLEPNVLEGSSFVITNSQSADTSTCSVTVESSCESDVQYSHVPVCCANFLTRVASLMVIYQ